MQTEAQITFKNMGHSDAVEDAIQKKIRWLEKFVPRVISCRVLVERPQHRHQQGDLFHIRLNVRLPGTELIINRSPSAHHAHEDIYVAIHDTFDGMRRRIEDYIRKRRGLTKRRESGSTGFVASLNADGGYGFLKTDDGRDVYFHRNSVIGFKFEDLRAGDHVKFAEEEGEKGPQASTLRFLHHDEPAHL